MTRRYGASSRERTTVEFHINPPRVLRILLWVTAALVILSTAAEVMVYNVPDFPLRDGIANLFRVSGERSLPTLYSTIMLLAAALLSGLIADAHRRAVRPYVHHWAALSFLFVLLAIDEHASLHEQSNELLRSLLNIPAGPLWYAWVVPAGALVAVFAIAFLRFIRHLPMLTRRLWTAGISSVGSSGSWARAVP